MATRQYIGARYVPKFYENGSGSSEWTANTAYEALTIVTRKGNSYTSKKPVPSSIGNPENNPEYWVLTGNYNQQISELINAVDNMSEITDQTEKMIGNRRGVWGIGRVDNASNRHYLYYSPDGKHFDLVRVMPSNMTSDLSRVCKIGDWFYYVTSHGYQKSKDLVTWTDPVFLEYTRITDPSQVWGSQFFVDGNTIYMLNAVTYQTGTIPLNAVGGSGSPYFRIDCYEVEQDANGNLHTKNVNNYVTILGGTDNTSYIDPFVVKTPEYGYVMCVKNELTCQIEIYNGQTLFTMSRVGITNALIGIEGCQMIVNDLGDIMLYVHAYSPRTVSALDDATASNAECNKLPAAIMRTRLTQSWNQSGASAANTFVSEMLWEVCDFPCYMRHPGFCVCDDEAYNILSKMTALAIPQQKTYYARGISKATTTLVRFTNAPADFATRYVITGGGLQDMTAEYVKIFAEDCPVYLTFQTGTQALVNSQIALGSGMLNTASGRVIDLSAQVDGGTLTMYAAGHGLLVPWKSV